MSFFNKNITLNCQGRLVTLDEPKVMGILNVTPDSFYDGGKYNGDQAYLHQVEKMLLEGANFIDIGGMSSRPGAETITIEEELDRVIAPIQNILQRFPDTIISIDTIHAKVAKAAVESGALIVNDISAGRLDSNMLATVGKLNVPYIAMHMKGEPNTMQSQSNYENVSLEVLDYFIDITKKCRAAGIKDIIIDPGFGFAKNLEQNYTLLNHLNDLDMLELPVLVGVSRKSMIYKLLESTAKEALNGSTALHMIALQKGASILRVHDVKEAVECVKIWKALQN
ncbi:MAG: dihydropteroate synthase [Chitinophagales bacterium]